MEKVIFLDFDGVLNTEHYQASSGGSYYHQLLLEDGGAGENETTLGDAGPARKNQGSNARLCPRRGHPEH